MTKPDFSKVRCPVDILGKIRFTGSKDTGAITQIHLTLTASAWAYLIAMHIWIDKIVPREGFKPESFKHFELIWYCIYKYADSKIAHVLQIQINITFSIYDYRLYKGSLLL